MIDLTKEALKHASSKWERFLIRVGVDSPIASYACRNLQEFSRGRSSLKGLQTVILPKVFYYPDGQERFEDGILPIRLRDETGEVQAFVRSGAVTSDSEWLVDVLNDGVNGGDTLYFPILRNGFSIPGYIHETPGIYLLDFKSFNTPRRRFDMDATIRKLASLLPEFNLPQPATVPVY